MGAKIGNASKTDVSLAEKYVSNLEKVLFAGKRSAARTAFGVSAANYHQYVVGYATLAFVSSFCKKE
ncbi:MAG: hypothetical protein IJP46_00740 [Prevotella sp.]|nr:hypothetical protein [Prevotella sp.]